MELQTAKNYLNHLKQDENTTKAPDSKRNLLDTVRFEIEAAFQNDAHNQERIENLESRVKRLMLENSVLWENLEKLDPGLAEGLAAHIYEGCSLSPREDSNTAEAF